MGSISTVSHGRGSDWTCNCPGPRSDQNRRPAKARQSQHENMADL